MDKTNLVSKKYRIRTLMFMGGYVAVNVAAILGAFDDIKRPGAIVFALVVTAPIIGQIWSLISWMRESDEFMRALTAKRFIIATGITLALASVWGFMEFYAAAPHISAAMVFPLFCVAFGLVTPLVRTSH